MLQWSEWMTCSSMCQGRSRPSPRPTSSPPKSWDCPLRLWTSAYRWHRSRIGSSVSAPLPPPSPHLLALTGALLRPGFIDEYFDNGEAGVPEASRCLEELSVEHLHPQVVKRLAQRSMERTDRERRLASLLLYSWRQQEKLSASAVHAGFTSLGCSLADISLDVPDAQEYFGGFVRRAQHDGLIADDFFETQ